MQELNIVELIESNPITKLSHTYNGKLITKIKEVFSVAEEVAEEIERPVLDVKPLIKNTDIKKPPLAKVESPVAPEIVQEEGLVIENDDIVIKIMREEMKGEQRSRRRRTIQISYY